ncbi:ANTAR domain-containing protein [Paeniglutamicibacter sp. ABSL32-1]|uniref:GAF and ANTAR domain-containing protein n=1 Tax=Paeniglutamicibacter quisquiliarum TaxID=2849498 RepID=UPI001C2D77C0|nr:ANTAR domain-containing protein [Paeniglutamicibacter quisquiliarum]MBV1780039.1 ANTAR domain-containing protein [Paeniglutamicibacter quisquiliarum]
MDAPRKMAAFGELCDLVSEMKNLQSLLESLVSQVAAAMTDAYGAVVECSVVMQRSRLPAAIAGSDDRVINLGQVEHPMDAGPWLHAIRTGLPVILADSSDSRWPDLGRELADSGFTGLLVLPLQLGPHVSGTLNFFTARIGAINDGLILDAMGYADGGSKALRMALRIAEAELKSQDLSAALESRTAIDLARGIIMAQNSCTAAEAFDFLRSASNNRNQKLHDIALAMTSRFAQSPGLTHFEA